MSLLPSTFKLTLVLLALYLQTHSNRTAEGAGAQYTDKRNKPLYNAAIGALQHMNGMSTPQAAEYLAMATSQALQAAAANAAAIIQAASASGVASGSGTAPGSGGDGGDSFS